MPEREDSPGRVLLVGAGPGDADLITLRGAAALRRADVVVHDSLIASDLLDFAPRDAECIDVGKRGHDAPTRSQADINALLVERARAGATVVRLKGGDPFVYGRGGEEASACRAAGIPFEVIPGVSSAFAVAAAAGIPVTDRRYGASVAVVTGHRDRLRPWTSIRWDQLAAGADTLVILMGMRNLERLVETLCENGRGPDTPAAVVMEGATPRQRVVEAPLRELPAAVRRAGLRAPAVVIVGEVVRLRDELGGFDRGPLFGARVMVTRPADPEDELVAALREAGATPVSMPMIVVEASRSGGDAVGVALDRLESYDALILTSRNAVRYFGKRLRARGLDAQSVLVPAFCVGPATARAAWELGLPEVDVPDAPVDAAALARFIMRRLQPSGRRFLFLRAEGAGELLPDLLREAGAQVDDAALYRTVPAPLDVVALREALLSGGLDAVTFASPSAVRVFAAGLDEPSRRALAAITVAAIGPTTAEALRAADIDPQVSAPRATPRALVDALARHRATQN